MPSLSRFRCNAVALLALMSLTCCLDINENTIYEDQNTLYAFSINVATNTFFTLMNVLDIHNAGDIYNRGELYFYNSEKAITYYQSGGDFINHGLFSMDSRSATRSGKLDFEPFTILNNGKFWLGLPDPSLISKINFSSARVFENYGPFTIEQSSGAPGTLRLTYSQFETVVMGNYGGVCLINVKLNQVTPVSGTGCIALGKNAAIDIGRTVVVDSQQTIAFTGENSQIVFSGLARTQTGTRSFNIAGYSSGKSIEFNIPPTSNSYSGDTMTLVFGSLTVNLRIGSGYNVDDFHFEATSTGGSRLTYSGSLPGTKAIPQVCYCDDFPAPRTQTETSSSAEPSSLSASSEIPSSSIEVESSITSAEESSSTAESASLSNEPETSEAPQSSSEAPLTSSEDTASSEDTLTSETSFPSSETQSLSGGVSESATDSSTSLSQSTAASFNPSVSRYTSAAPSSSISGAESSSTLPEPFSSSEIESGLAESSSHQVSSSVVDPTNTFNGSHSTWTASRTITQWVTYCPVCPSKQTTVSGWIYTTVVGGTTTVTTEICPPETSQTSKKTTISTFTSVYNGETQTFVVCEDEKEGVKTVYTSLCTDATPDEAVPTATTVAAGAITPTLSVVRSTQAGSTSTSTVAAVSTYEAGAATPSVISFSLLLFAAVFAFF